MLLGISKRCALMREPHVWISKAHSSARSQAWRMPAEPFHLYKSDQWSPEWGPWVGSGSRGCTGTLRVMEISWVTCSSYVIVRTLQTAHYTAHFIVNVLHMKVRVEFWGDLRKCLLPGPVLHVVALLSCPCSPDPILSLRSEPAWPQAAGLEQCLYNHST